MNVTPEVIEAVAAETYTGTACDDSGPFEVFTERKKDHYRAKAKSVLETAARTSEGDGDSFELQAKLTTGETVRVKVSGYSSMRQGCSALVKLADVHTLASLIAASDNDDDGDDS